MFKTTYSRFNKWITLDIYLHLDVPIGVVGVLASKNAEINSFKLRLHVLSEHCSRPAE